MSLKTAISTLKQWVGLESKPVPPPPPPTRLEIVKEEYGKLGEEERVQYREKELAELTILVKQTLASGSKDFDIIKHGLENQEAVIFLTKESVKNKELKETEPEFLEILGALDTLVELLKLLSVSGKEINEQLEQYVHQFEEQLVLTEAGGEYKLGVSENKEWIRLPFLKFLTSKRLDKKVPIAELLKFFKDIPQVRFLELDSRVPFHPISLLDTELFIAEKKVVPLYLKDNEQFYILIIN